MNGVLEKVTALGSGVLCIESRYSMGINTIHASATMHCIHSISHHNNAIHPGMVSRLYQKPSGCFLPIQCLNSALE